MKFEENVTEIKLLTMAQNTCVAVVVLKDRDCLFHWTLEEIVAQSDDSKFVKSQIEVTPFEISQVNKKAGPIKAFPVFKEIKSTSN